MLVLGNSYTFDIFGLTQDGCGIAVLDGVKVFIEGVLPGERVRGTITKIEADYAAAKLFEIVEAKGERVIPFCRYFHECGGCSLQFIPYEKQLIVKRDIVKEAMIRVAGIDADIVKETIGSPDIMNYRNKAQYPVQYSNGKYKIGFYKTRTRQVADIEFCSIQHKYSNDVREAVKDYLNQMLQRDGEHDKKAFEIRHIVTRVSRKTGEVMVILVLDTLLEKLPNIEKLIEAIVGRVPSVKSIYVNYNMTETNQIMGEKNSLIFGKEKIVDSIGCYSFEISPLSFFQVNSRQTEVLYEKIREFSAPTGNETVFDLYCGTGTISIYLSQGAGRVIGVEGVEEAVKDAMNNMQINRVKNIRFVCGRVEHVIGEINERADVVIVDPPRKGCKKEVLDAILRIISEEALDYLNYDDIAKISYWLGNFWVGIQYEMNNRPEEIRVIEQRGSMSGNSGELKEDDNIVLVRRIVPVDEDRNIIKYGATGSGRQYSIPSWGVRGHDRTLPDGRVIHVLPYRQGKERKNSDTFVKKGYQFVDEKIDSDID
ncbi:MAG TPA: 23S rRNA (uracil(1939)-C(5))-methyltransferase RlmD [Pseudobacteroides sp.]|nr:23S rRNA (uracil(1939)-C(5))-methyltransferase RlmD [Pseudobacteroides sp.]